MILWKNKLNYFARRREASNCTILTVSPPIYAAGKKLFYVEFFYRLPIVQGGTFAFITPTFAILSLPQWTCSKTEGQLSCFAVIRDLKGAKSWFVHLEKFRKNLG